MAWVEQARVVDLQAAASPSELLESESGVSELKTSPLPTAVGQSLGLVWEANYGLDHSSFKVGSDALFSVPSDHSPQGHRSQQKDDCRYGQRSEPADHVLENKNRHGGETWRQVWREPK